MRFIDESNIVSPHSCRPIVRRGLGMSALCGQWSVGHEEVRLVQVQVQITRPIAGTHAIRSHHHAHHIGEHSEPA